MRHSQPLRIFSKIFFSFSASTLVEENATLNISEWISPGVSIGPIGFPSISPEPCSNFPSSKTENILREVRYTRNLQLCRMMLRFLISTQFYRSKTTIYTVSTSIYIQFFKTTKNSFVILLNNFFFQSNAVWSKIANYIKPVNDTVQSSLIYFLAILTNITVSHENNIASCLLKNK